MMLCCQLGSAGGGSISSPESSNLNHHDIHPVFLVKYCSRQFFLFILLVKLEFNETGILFGAATISDELRKRFQLSMKNFFKMLPEAQN
jgi:hypothetical protein